MSRRPQFRLSLGTLVSKSFAVYFRNFIPFLFLSAVTLSPWIAWSFLAPIDPNDRGMVFLAGLTSTLLTYILTGSLVYGVVQQLRGKPASMGEAVTKGLQAFGRVLGTGLLCGIRIALMSILIIPGIWEQCRLYVALPAAVMEGTAGSTAIERSIRLTDGSKWVIFGSWFIIYLLPVVIIAAIAFIDPNTELPLWLEVGMTVALAPLSAVAMSVCYFLLRQGKENKSVAELAAVFD